ncbi:unnamed protein product, partial [Callosobruchus maculatus]
MRNVALLVLDAVWEKIEFPPYFKKFCHKHRCAISRKSSASTSQTKSQPNASTLSINSHCGETEPLSNPTIFPGT